MGEGRAGTGFSVVEDLVWYRGDPESRALGVELLQLRVEDEREQFRRRMKEEMYGELAEVLKYKKVENRTKPVSTTLPEDCRIQRHRHPDPLKEMPELPV